MRIAVAIVTRGRAGVLCAGLKRLEAQTRQPDQMILSATAPEDLRGAASTRLGANATLAFGEAGVAAQRNRALKLARRADVIVFFDDDFTAFEDSLAGIEALFAARPKLVAATGHVVADGARGAPLTEEMAVRAARTARRTTSERQVIGLYGCNMAIRMSAARSMRFDEGLPLYGWQEDLDFGARLARRGEVIRTGAFGGAHLGVKGGRHPQRGLGYAQVANPARLARGGCVPVWYLTRLALGNIAANAAGAAIGDKWADRRGRLAGNLIALADMARGRLDPERARVL